MNNKQLMLAVSEYSQTSNKKDFIFKYDNHLYRIKIKKDGTPNIKEICTGLPSLIDLENKGDSFNPSWHYRFSVLSTVHGSAEMLLHPKEFSSDRTFNKSILRRIPVLFTGNKRDFEMFLDWEFEKFDFSSYHEEA